jgi:CBS domain-containing protein
MGSEKTKVKEVMTKELVTVTSGGSLIEAVSTMNQKSVNRLIVVSEEGAVGIVTKKDIFRFAASDTTGRQLDQVKVEEVMSQELITMDENEMVPSAATLMLSNGISSVIITGYQDAIVGIVTKSDLVKFYAQKLDKKYKVKDVMMRPVVTIGPRNSIFFAAELMQKKKVGRLIVVDGMVRGIVALSDLVSVSPQLIAGRRSTEGSYYSESGSFIPTPVGPALTVEDIIRTNLISVTSETDLAEAAKLMVERKVSGLPVIDGATTLSGIVTKSDICRAIAKFDTKRAEKDTVTTID